VQHFNLGPTTTTIPRGWRGKEELLFRRPSSTKSSFRPFSNPPTRSSSAPSARSLPAAIPNLLPGGEQISPPSEEEKAVRPGERKREKEPRVSLLTLLDIRRVRRRVNVLLPRRGKKTHLPLPSFLPSRAAATTPLRGEINGNFPLRKQEESLFYCVI